MEPPSWAARISRHRRLFWLFFFLTLCYMIWIRIYMSPLSSGEFVQFEIAKTVNKAQAIIQSWKDTGKYDRGVGASTYAYLFMVLYTLAIGFGCRFLSACTGNEILAKGGKGFAWLIVIATICDLIENIALSKTLTGDVSQVNVSIAYHLARAKFSIVIVCILFMVSCSLYWMIGRSSGEKNRLL